MANQNRAFSLPLYLAAFVISIVIFGIGIYAGTIVDKGSLSGISADVERVLQRLESAQLLLFLDDSSSFCPVYSGELQKLERDTEKIGQKLDLLADKGTFDIELKRQYFILEAQAYLLSKKVNDRCNVGDLLVLYFYSNNNCENCRQQGEDLLRARDRFLASTNRTVKIYSFDGELGSPVADALKQKYNVSGYPTVIINENAYRGYNSIEKMLGLFEEG